jgi:hypothetical protein
MLSAAEWVFISFIAVNLTLIGGLFYHVKNGTLPWRGKDEEVK